jgi:bifunctional UDP-N-acetylglucosamine pyrophosphorylase / glucosamine-1-phosphate N-acetyltransferase
MPTTPDAYAVILAAGRGTRMKSALAKVLHPLLGRPMVGHVVASARGAGLAPVLVVNHQEEAVRAAFAGTDTQFVRQLQTLGTGDAVASALSVLPESGTVVVMAGDAPLIRCETISALLAAHGDAAVTVLTVVLADGAHYGRLERDGSGMPLRIVEASEASAEQLELCEINTGLYCFDIAWLRAVLPTLEPHAPKNEVYLTDTVERAAAEGRARVVTHDDPEEVAGINDRLELALTRTVLQARIVEAHGRAGVDFLSPHSVLIDHSVTIAADVSVGPGVVLQGSTCIAEGSTIGPYCHLVDAEIGPGVSVHSHSVIETAQVESGASVGPYARLRPQSRVCEGARVGNFVEMKKSTIGPGAKVNHLSYIGDATVGAQANVGAGTITCNYDGFGKSPTTIDEGAFIGSNTALVAPVTVGAGAIVGAGSVITKDVPAGAVSIARGTQSNLEDAADRFRARARSKAGDSDDG